jgi:hypothetical protein
MTDQAVSRIASASNTDQKMDARDLLALLYREIGISAVAAALSVSTGKDNDQEAVVTYPSVELPAKTGLAA